MLCRRSASLIRMTRTSCAIASSILRKFSACASSRGLELDLVELGDAVDHVGDGLAERRLDLGLGDVGVLHHVVEERCGEPLRVEPPLRQDAGYRQRVRDIRFAGFSKLALMRVLGEGKRALDQRDVRRRQVVAKMSGEFGDFRHVWRSPRKGLTAADRQTRALRLEQHLDANLSGGDFAQRNDRRLVAVAIDQRLRAGADLTRTIGGGERELETVGYLDQTIFDRDAGHGCSYFS